MGDLRVDRRGVRALGNVRFRHHQTNELMLIPTPANDPNDPLNWSQRQKYYLVVVICLATMLSNFLAAGPSIAILGTALDFFPTDAKSQSVAQTAYFFTTTALMQGVGNFIWMPLANKFGRRPVYVTSYAIYFACAVWLVFETNYSRFLAGRILLGFGAGAAETTAPLTITDIFYLHERGTIMALYTSFLCVGVALGVIIDGLILINNDWRVIYQVASGLIGLVLVLAFFTFPETAYVRNVGNATEKQEAEKSSSSTSSSSDNDSKRSPGRTPGKESYIHSLKLYHKTWTEENLVKLLFRPFALILLPPILWAALVQSVTIGFLVAMTSNTASAYESAYGFSEWQAGLCFVAAVIGSLLGVPVGGQLGDKTADWFTKQNGWIRDPEMRLPAVTLCLVSTPLSLILYGVGIQRRLHWICPTIGLGLLNFSITQGTNICLVYVIDSYRPVAGEVTLAVMGFKSLFGFLLSFYTNPWVEQVGYAKAYGTMAGIASCMLLLWIPLYFWGKAIRHATWNWPFLSYIHWADDREVGE